MDRQVLDSIDKLSKKKIDRRTLLKLSAGAVGALALDSLLASCVPAPSPTPVPPTPTKVVVATPTPAPPKPTPTATPFVDTGPLAKVGLILDPNPPGVVPKRGGTIVGAQTGDYTDFDPFETGAIRFPFHHNVYTPLFYYDKDLKVIPALAESYKLSDDKLTLTVKLRGGVKWHNGREFVADDVVFNIERGMSKETGRSVYPQTLTMKGARAVDKYTVEILYKEPTANLFDVLTFMGMVAKEAVAEIKSKAVGTGPFKLEKWIPGQESLFVRNENYWEPGLPCVDAFRIRSFKDIPSMVLSLEAGELDVVRSLPYSDAPRIDKKPGFKVFRPVDLFFFNVYIHTKKKPFDNKKVRQAMAWSIDRQTIVDKVLSGWSEPACTPYPKTSWAHDPVLNRHYGFDLDRARALLKEAGYDKGFEFTAIGSPIFAEFTQNALIWQSDLAKIGVKLNLQEVASAEYYDRLFAGNFEVMMSSSGRGHKDPAYPLAIQPAYRTGGNMLGWQSDEYERLLREGTREFDQAKRKEVYKKIQEILLDEAFEIIIARAVMLYGVRTSNLHDFRNDVDTYWMFHRSWLG
ncbi:MAG: ABC transporter substrate-binding protein [Chloroflexi bacterium]|nr:ABC transporter substrate-binding protein [Chloroflexota bacterium]MCL5076003.1 ABC transporter substrate-binding protein [Chloroflexota bacterium]